MAMVCFHPDHPISPFAIEREMDQLCTASLLLEFCLYSHANSRYMVLLSVNDSIKVRRQFFNKCVLLHSTVANIGTGFHLPFHCILTSDYKFMLSKTPSLISPCQIIYTWVHACQINSSFSLYLCTNIQ